MERNSQAWVLIAAILASSMAFIDGSALTVVLPTLQTELGANASQLLWIVNGYLLVLASLILVGGSLGDRFGRKKLFMAGIVFFSAASLACGLSPSVELLIAARLLQGIGGALMVPGSLSIITATIPSDRQGRAIGTWSAITTLVTIAGPVLGGLLADAGLWRFVFLINLPLGLTAFSILAARVPETTDPSIGKSIDIPGTVLVSAGLAGLSYGFMTASDTGFGNAGVLFSLGLGAAAIVGFIVVEARSPNPIMPLFLFKSRTFSGANLLTFFLYGALSVVTVFVSLNLIQIQGYSKTEAGLATLPMAALLVLLSRVAGAVLDRIGPRPLLTLGPAITGFGFLWLAFAGLGTGAADYWVRFFPGMMVFGIGMGITVAPLTASVMAAAPKVYAGAASGINNAVARIAGVLALAIFGALAILGFSDSVVEHGSGLGLSTEQAVALHQEVKNFGNAQVPVTIPSETADTLRAHMTASFVGSYRIVMIACAVLAWLSAAAAFVLIGPRNKTQVAKSTETSEP